MLYITYTLMYYLRKNERLSRESQVNRRYPFSLLQVNRPLAKRGSS